ncbi:MAG: hypothetical protein HY453_01675 [Parcubacteria group bacterium]|nr:hypothetical protein [Parcubacteria group bacterium]
MKPSFRPILLTLLAAVAILAIIAINNSRRSDSPFLSNQDEKTPLDTFDDKQPESTSKRLGIEYEDFALFSKDSPLNKKIPNNPSIDPKSPRLIERFASDTKDLFTIQVKQYSVPVYFSDANTPKTSVPLTCGSEWETGVNKLKNVPIPKRASPSADEGINPRQCGSEIPDVCDCNMTVIDLEKRCIYEFWQADIVNGSWKASWGNAISLDGSGIYPNGMSTRGSGFSLIAGVIWPGELKMGIIDHALLFANPLPKAGGPVLPATDSDGESDEDFVLPEGAHLQLDPSLDLNDPSLGLTSYEKTIAKAMQEYGMFLTDSGDFGIALYAVDPRSYTKNPYQDVWGDQDFVSIGNIPGDKFRVLKLPEQYEPDLSVVKNDCAVFE